MRVRPNTLKRPYYPFWGLIFPAVCCIGFSLGRPQTSPPSSLPVIPVLRIYDFGRTLFFMVGFTMLIKDWGAQLLSVLVLVQSVLLLDGLPSMALPGEHCRERCLAQGHLGSTWSCRDLPVAKPTPYRLRNHCLCTTVCMSIVCKG